MSDERATGSVHDAHDERRSHYPSRGYALVEIDTWRPPGEALATLDRRFTLSSIRMPSATDGLDWVVYDRDGFAYSEADLRDPTDDDDPETAIRAALETIEDEDVRERRVALARLNRLSEDHPGACLDAVPRLGPLLEAFAPEEQAETLEVFARVAEDYPGHLTPAVGEVLQVLSADADEDAHLALAATRIVKRVAGVDPGAAVDAVPTLAVLVHDDSPAATAAIAALHHIATVYPETVVPCVPDLIERIEDGDVGDRVGALSVIGHIAKDHPHIAEATIPTAIALLEADAYRVRGNAGGLLADLASAYPEQVAPAVPRAIALLADDHRKVRFNAAAVLARVAKAKPAAVADAVDPLIDRLGDEFTYTRSNACWALGALEAERARPELERLAADDPEKPVRRAAAWAIHRIA